MPLKFERVDDSFRQGRLRIHYQDEFGQPRFFEFSPVLEVADIRNFAGELIQQVNELLARPGPSGMCCRVRPLEPERGLDRIGSL